MYQTSFYWYTTHVDQIDAVGHGTWLNQFHPDHNLELGEREE